MLFRIFQKVKSNLQAIKTRSSKSKQKKTFFQRGSPMVLVQKWPFLKLFFYAIQTRKMYSMIFQNEKMPFQAIKKRSSKSQKINIFPKRLTHGFGPKMAIFQTFLFNAIQTREMYSMIFQNEEMPFQAIKTRIIKSSKSRKSVIFPKGLTHGFSPEMANFPTFFFRQFMPGKCLL